MKRIIILGATGSIGESTLRVVEALPDRFRVVGMSAAQNGDKLLELARRHRVPHLALTDSAEAKRIHPFAPAGTTVWGGPEGIEALAALPEADIVVCAIVGMAGLRPTVAAIEAGHDVALATKEVLVAAGDHVMRLREARGINLLPVDSEHSAIFQALQSPAFEPACVRKANTPKARHAESRIHNLILTASGGPFFFTPEIDFTRITPAQALCHPRWKMGRKVTIDSATLMNKGLELIEACRLYALPEDRVDIWVHPQSIVHSLVQFTDGATLAQLSPPDMRLPIQFALTWPERIAAPMPLLTLAETASLTFSAPDENRFPSLALARRAIRTGGGLPAVMNAANEIAVEAFLEEKTGFHAIPLCVEAVMNELAGETPATIAEVIALDAEARRIARDRC